MKTRATREEQEERKKKRKAGKEGKEKRDSEELLTEEERSRKRQIICRWLRI